MLEKGYDARVIGLLIERLVGEKLLDDRRYVDNFVTYRAARGHGPLRVRAELRQIGLSGPIVEDALDGYPNWLIQLRKTQQKKFGCELPTEYADRQRQVRFLNYRGFTGAQIRLALGFDTDLDSTTEDL